MGVGEPKKGVREGPGDSGRETQGEAKQLPSAAVAIHSSPFLAVGERNWKQGSR